MKSISSSSSSSSSSFLALPSVVVASLLDYLSSAEIIRLSTLSSKHLHTTVADEGNIWSRLLMSRLSTFLPASSYYTEAKRITSLVEELGQEGADEGDEEKEEDDRTEAEETCHQRLTARLHLAHLSSTSSSSSSAEEIGSKTTKDFAEWAKVFHCDAFACSRDAQRQCASCGHFLCLECSVRCDEDKKKTCGHHDRTGCAFALCSSCWDKTSSMVDLMDYNGSSTISTEKADGEEKEKEFSANGSSKSKPPSSLSLLCPAHLDLCFIGGTNCENKQSFLVQ